MSRLDSFIRRLEAQRACIDLALSLIDDVPGVVFEVGLGNGRTFDHLRSNLGARRILVFEQDPNPHPDCWPASEDLIIGDLVDTLPQACSRWSALVSLIHSDIGSGNPDRDCPLAERLGQSFPTLLAPGGVLLSDQPLGDIALEPLPSPRAVDPGRYFIYQRG